MYFHPQERAVVLINGPSLHTVAKAIDLDIDFKKLLSFFRSRAHLLRATYYAIVPDSDEYIAIRRLTDWLNYNGYSTVIKQRVETVDANGRRRTSSRVDLEMTVDAMRQAQHVDHVILFSGDSDYCYLVSALQEQAKRVTVVSTLQTQPPLVSDSLRRAADQFLDLADIADQISRTNSKAADTRIAVSSE